MEGKDSNGWFSVELSDAGADGVQALWKGSDGNNDFELPLKGSTMDDVMNAFALPFQLMEHPEAADIVGVAVVTILNPFFAFVDSSLELGGHWEIPGANGTVEVDVADSGCDVAGIAGRQVTVTAPEDKIVSCVALDVPAAVQLSIEANGEKADVTLVDYRAK